MQHHVYSTSDKYPIAILIKSAAFNLQELENSYVKALEAHGVNREDLILIGLPYQDNGKAPVKFIKEQLDTLMSSLESVGTTTIYCADANYFKVLTKETKAEPHLGYVLPCLYGDYKNVDVVLGVNHKSLIYNPANESKLEMSIQTLTDYLNNTYEGLGNNIIQAAQYLHDPDEILSELGKLIDEPMLTVDIEGFSLDFNKAGVGTITFCKNQHEGIAFPVDLGTQNKVAKTIRGYVKMFFERYDGYTIWHNAPYDMKALIYNLWMKDLLDTENMLIGLEVMTRKFHDTKLIAYLALNSVARSSYGLKDLAHAFAGNYAIDVKDITAHPVEDVLKYNLIDGLSTWYVFNTYWPKMVADNQLDIYENLFLPSQKTIIQIELTGMPLNAERVQEVKYELESIAHNQYRTIMSSSYVKLANKELQIMAQKAANAKLKTKQHPLSKYAGVVLNPGSGDQLRVLLYEVLGLPVIATTKTGLPSTKAKVLNNLKNHTDDSKVHTLLGAIAGYLEAKKILSTFITAFEQAIDKGDGVVYLHGSFNLGGTVSGRLSSSDPNLQNLPSGSTYGKLVKSCFQAPNGWIFCGADFNSLEDYISALTTNDPNKLKVYLDGYDGHCLRAYKYFSAQMPDVDPDSVESINSIEEKHNKLRSKSKAPTFALTYQGTYHTLMKNLGFPYDEAKAIEENYHDLYRVSDAWVQDRIDEAAKQGYLEVAFGLRVRTPLLHQSLRNHSSTPYETHKEGRTAGNALGQSYGLLNNRAANEFMQRVWASPYRHDIKPVALIHDAIYLIIRDNSQVLDWVNKNLIDCMRWQELPEIQHDMVKLGASLDIYWPSWAEELTLPNDAPTQEIIDMCKDHFTAVMQDKET